jgi:hypothetical protein
MGLMSMENFSRSFRENRKPRKLAEETVTLLTRSKSKFTEPVNLHHEDCHQCQKLLQHTEFFGQIDSLSSHTRSHSADFRKRWMSQKEAVDRWKSFGPSCHHFFRRSLCMSSVLCDCVAFYAALKPRSTVCHLQMRNSKEACPSRNCSSLGNLMMPLQPLDKDHRNPIDESR